MTFWTISAIVFLAFEAWVLYRIKSHVQYAIESRRVYSIPGRSEHRQVIEDALLLLKHIGGAELIISKVYQLFAIILSVTKQFYIGIGLISLGILDTILSPKLSKPWLYVLKIADGILSIAGLAWLAWNR